MIYLWIALGSAIGGAGRYWCNNVVSSAFGDAFPWGTIAVNVAGSFLIGFLASIDPFPGRSWLPGPEARALPHGWRLRRLHDVFRLQPADAGSPAKRPMAGSSRQHRPVGSALPSRGLDRSSRLHSPGPNPPGLKPVSGSCQPSHSRSRARKTLPPARHRLPGGSLHNAHRPRQGKLHRPQRPPLAIILTASFDRAPPQPATSSGSDGALKHLLTRRPQTAGPHPGMPLPGTARFRKPPSASQSLPNPAAMRQQPNSTPTPIHPRQASDKPERLRPTPSRAHPDPTTRE